MRVLDSTQAAQELAKALGRPVLLLARLHEYLEFLEETTFVDSEGVTRLLAAPFFGTQQSYGAGRADVYPIPDYNDCLIVCETEEELDRLYDLTYGDDGMTESGKAARLAAGYPEYRGAHRVYALTISADGRLGTENT